MGLIGLFIGFVAGAAIGAFFLCSKIMEFIAEFIPTSLPVPCWLIVGGIAGIICWKIIPF
jgi:hypothetical protein